MREMQDPESGVPVRSQKQFLTSIPSAFMGECHRYLCCGVSGHRGQDSTTVGCLRVAGYDLIEWLMERLAIEESGTVPCDRYSALSLARLDSTRHGLAQPQPVLNDTLSIVPLRSIRSAFPSMLSARCLERASIIYQRIIHHTEYSLSFRSNMNYLSRCLSKREINGGENPRILFAADSWKSAECSRGFSGLRSVIFFVALAQMKTVNCSPVSSRNSRRVNLGNANSSS